jgi:hypothetical protein
MGKGKPARVVQPKPKFWEKNGVYLIPFGYTTFKYLKQVYPNVKKITLIKNCTPMAICKEFLQEREYGYGETCITYEEITNTIKFNININGKDIFWDGTNFLYLKTIICNECFILGELTPFRGCQTHISKCDHSVRNQKAKICDYCFARSFASFWTEYVECLLPTNINGEIQNALKITKASVHDVLFKCKDCNHIFPKRPTNIRPSIKGDKGRISFCPFCSNQKLCEAEDCDLCFTKSLASYDKEKIDCLIIGNPRFIFKRCALIGDFQCFKCQHVFPSTISSITSGHWCPYCCVPGQKLCTDEDCSECFEKSFASFDKLKIACLRPITLNPRNLFLHATSKQQFECSTCLHIFTKIIGDVSNGEWCTYCSGTTLCGRKECKICFEKSFASSDSQRVACMMSNKDPYTMFKHSDEKFPFKCYKCTYIFISFPDLVSRGKWCPRCKMSKGELACEKLLTSKGIKSTPQFKLRSLGNKEFDFYFEWNNRKYLLEYDGEPHFQFIPFFHKTHDNFLHRQNVDVEKTTAGIKEDYFIIRIDYTALKSLELHLDTALNLTENDTFYLSNPGMYHYMLPSL